MVAIDWTNLWPPGSPMNYTHINESLDIISQGCFVHHSPTACVRNQLLFWISLLTLLLCVARLVRFYQHYFSQWFPYSIIVLAAVECLTLLVKYIYERNDAFFDFVACYCKLLQFITLCNYHWVIASRILRKENLISWFMIPMAFFTALYFLFVIVLGILTAHNSWDECIQPQWLLLSLPEFFIVQLELIPAVLINRKINRISAEDSFKCNQKVYLWSTVLVYEISAIVCLSQEIVFITVVSKKNGCSALYGYHQEIYSVIHFFTTVVKYFCPIWVLLWFVEPARSLTPEEQERLLGVSTTSSFSTTSSLYRPLSSGGESSRASSPVWCRNFHSSSATPVCSPSSLAPISEEEDADHPPTKAPYCSYGSINNHGRTHMSSCGCDARAPLI